jgi:hypothetical protein
MKRTLHVIVDHHAAWSDEVELFRIGLNGGVGLRQDASPLSVVRERHHHAAVGLAENTTLKRLNAPRGVWAMMVKLGAE